MIRTLIVAIVAVLLASQIVRNAAVSAWATTAPDRAARLWPDHPGVSLSAGMTKIARSARQAATVDSGTIRQIVEVERIAPLRPEPFLVRGVQAQLSGDGALAEKAFGEAKWRQGRSLPARYFLAQRYFERRDDRRGLAEVAVLSRLIPNAVDSLAPYVATYARDRANWPQLQSMFADGSSLADATLSQLARDPNATGTVVALAGPPRSSVPNWLPVMLNTLVDAKQYERARQLWADRFGLGPQTGLLYDPDFTRPGPIAPFNWLLAPSAAGLAERQPGGGMHVIFYGQQDGVLAGQLLLLKPGSYRFAVQANGSATNSDSLNWRLTCAPTNAPIATASLDEAISGWRFEIPENCPAQRLEFGGTVSDLPQQAEVRIRRVELRQDRSDG